MDMSKKDLAELCAMKRRLQELFQKYPVDDFVWDAGQAVDACIKANIADQTG